MNILFDLSKEHPIIPHLEIISLYKAYQNDYAIIHDDENVAIVDANIDSDFLNILTSRLAFTHSISHFLFQSSSIDDMKQKNTSLLQTLDGSVAIRYKNRSNTYNSNEIVHTLASIFTKNMPVDLEHPDHEIYAIITNYHIFIGQRLYSLNRNNFEKRKAQFRSFFSPISLHPKLARGLVNISQVIPENKVLDPFCGTGGFLIEAGLIGCTLYGSDIESQMVKGTMKNLSQYNISPKQLFTSDIGDISNTIDEEIDAVITDAPYGKSTTTKNEDLEELYKRAFESIATVLKPKGHIVMGLPDKSFESLLQHYFTINHVIIVPVHRSLTRYFYCGIKK